MRLLTLRNILYITTLVLMLSAISFFTYKAYFVYQEYQKIEDRNLRYSHFNDLYNLLKLIEEERLLSSRYLSATLSFDKLKEKRSQVNSLLEESSISLTKEIELVRKKIDKGNVEYKEIIYNAYEKQIIEPIIVKMQKLCFSKIEQNILRLAKLRNSIELEDSFLAFILLNSKVMNSSDLKFWDNIVANRVLPFFMQSRKTSDKNFQKIGDEEYTQIFIDSKSGEYRVSFDKWHYLTIQKLEKIKQLENRFSKIEINKINNMILSKKSNIKKFLSIVLLLFLLMLVILFLIYYFFKIKNDTHYLKNTLKNIEVDIDIEKRRELEALLARNNSIEIYKFLANAIKEPNRAKDLFLANMSHEIRTPLNGIVGFTKELRQTPLNADQEEMLSIIEESSNQLIHIVNDILDFSKIKAGKVELESIPFDPIATFESSVDTFIAKAREKKVELKVNIDPTIPIELIGDPTKLSQILSNLISNAIKFTDEEGLVVISMLKIMEDEKSTLLKFMVKDSGIGVNVEEKKKIFDAFSQADVSTNRKYGGTGLGLSISSQFIQYMGGELEIQSEVGEGTSFYFSLNLEKSSSLQYNKLNFSSYNIGYIPSISFQDMDIYLKNYVEFYGAKFQTYNRYEVLNLEKNELPNLLFIDYKCFKSRKQLEVFLNLPIQTILIVADNREDELIEVRDKIDYLLHKPVNFTRTLKALELLDRKKIESSSLAQKYKTIQFINKKALVAEDNKINQKLMKNILERFGFNVTIVENGKESIQLRKESSSSFDIIFMDIQMPIMGGVEATKKILSLEKEEEIEHIPIIALTANALEGDREKYLSFGMDGYLSKPINMDSLEEILVTFII